MGDPTTLTLNLAFLGTVVIGLVMFLLVFLIFVIILMIAGAANLVAVLGTVLLAKPPGQHSVPAAQASGAGHPPDASHARAQNPIGPAASAEHPSRGASPDKSTPPATQRASAGERDTSHAPSGSPYIPAGLIKRGGSPSTENGTSVPEERRRAS